MEDAGCIGRRPEGRRHVSELGQGRVGDHTLDIVLHQTDQAHEEGSGGTDDHDQRERCFRKLVERRHARHHEDAGGDHGSCVYQGRDGGGTFHRVRQPHVQRNLGRLAHGADEQQDADQRHQGNAAEDVDLLLGEAEGGVCRHVEDLPVIHRPEIHGDGGDAKNEAEVTHPVDEKCLEVGEDGGFALRPESDQQIGDQAHRLPAEEQLEEIVGHHQHQHGEGEERDIAEETLIAVAAGQGFLGPVLLVVGHVADGVDVHH